MTDNSPPGSAEKKMQRYSPTLTAEIKNNQITTLISSQQAMLKRHTHGIDLFDYEKVQQSADEYMGMCSETATYPNFEGLCGVFGLSRQWVYQFIRTHPEHETAKYLDRLRITWLSGKFSLSEKGVLDSASVIFQSKNSMMGYSDRHELDIITALPEDERAKRPEWGQALSDNEYCKKLVEEITTIEDFDIE